MNESGAHPATVAEVIGLALRTSVQRLVEHEAGVRDGADPEDVHQARVATRRMRSDLRTFGDFVDVTWANDLRGELQWLGSELGQVRDIEVMLERLRADICSLPEEEQEDAERLVRRLLADWHAARSHMLEQLAGSRYVELRERLVLASERPRVTPWAYLHAEQVLPRVVVAPWKKLKRAVERLGDPPAEEALHEVRIRAKRTRYAAEATVPVFGKPAQQFAKAMAAVQTVLGDHQDAVVARAWVVKTASEVDANEAFAAGVLAEREAHAARVASEEFAGVWARARDKHLRAWL
jgi:CHAD domain-containing protein